jgi:uncharacterized surface protein with fasciclin (FAS1) repeats
MNMCRFSILYTALIVSSCNGSYLRETATDTRKLQTLPTLDDIVLTDANLTTLAAAFETAELVGRLCTTCNFTFFAPINEAFAAIDQAYLATLLTPSWILHLQNLLAFHITLPTDSGERLLSTDLVDGQVLEMLNSEQVTVNDRKRGISLTSPLTVGSNIVEADILASNGVLHKLDSLLIPGFFGVDVFALGNNYVEFTILQELMELIGLAGTEGEYTVLAPTNEAFLALGNETLVALKGDTKTLGKILANHIIVGVYPSLYLQDGLVLESLGGLNITVTLNTTDIPVVMFNDATVIVADILAKNGIVHAIDMVLLEADTASDVPSETPSDVPSEMPSSLLSDIPSAIPSSAPSDVPSDSLSDIPTEMPNCDNKSEAPSSAPSNVPSQTPSDVPSEIPSDAPSDSPSDAPSDAPSDSPSASPSIAPLAR